MKKRKPCGSRGFNGASDCKTERSHDALDHQNNQPKTSKELLVEFFKNNSMPDGRHSLQRNNKYRKYESGKQLIFKENKLCSPEKHERAVKLLADELGV
ncbi:MAG: hypothetical protein HQL52_16410 [Magnetococcales bacterium]|nr:hypothetical protein [Magnetococcales bacterium]